jgi:cell wall-associated NlpC family hydrolase
VSPPTFAKQAEQQIWRSTARHLVAGVCFFLIAAASGCSTAPPAKAPPSQRETGTGEALVRIAAQQIGTPYRFGGDNPHGFDCSGLVFFTHDRLGLEVPRTAAEQSRAAQPVALGALVPGDLVFFRIRGRDVDHVGIYTGRGRFIHAPRSGLVVSYAYLDDPFYHRHFAGAGRFWSPAAQRLSARGPRS